MNRYLGDKKFILLFVLPALLAFVLFAIVPLFITAYYSLFLYNGVSKMSFTFMNNYVKLINDKNFQHAAWNAVVLMLASLLIQLPISFILANILARGTRGEKTFRTIYFVPVLISSTVIGQLFLNVFNSEHGLLNALIKLFSPNFQFSWLTNSHTAFLTTVVPAVWQYIGYHMLILYAGMKSIPSDYYEAAQIDGATGWTATFRVTIPLLAPVIKTCAIFAIVGSIKAFDLIYVMTNGGPNNVSHVPATLMYNNLFKRGLFGYGSAQAFSIVVACLLLSWLVTMLFRRAEENATM